MADDLLVTLGLKVKDLIAGFSGGIVYAFMSKRSGMWSIIGSVTIGALTSNYLGASVVKFTGLGEEVAGFIVGLCGMTICQKIIDKSKDWKAEVPRAKL